FLRSASSIRLVSIYPVSMIPFSCLRHSMKTWQAIIFDLDDTLYSERSFVLSGFRAVAAHIAEQVSLPSEDVYQQLEKLFRQGVRGNTFDLWLSEQQLADQIAVHDLVEVYRNHTPD